MTSPVRVRGLVHRFGATKALDGIDLDLVQGRRLGLSGPNGAGRTTLLHIAAALLPPTAGTVEIAGIDAGRFPFDARAHAMYVGSHLPAGTGLRVREYLTFIRKARSGRTRSLTTISTEAALERAELSPDAVVDQLSRGLRKRLALTTALVVSPPVLLLDDPFSALDSSARNVFLEWIIESCEAGVTLISAVNDTDADHALCDTVLRMALGRVVSQTSHARGVSDHHLARVVGGA